MRQSWFNLILEGTDFFRRTVSQRGMTFSVNFVHVHCCVEESLKDLLPLLSQRVKLICLNLSFMLTWL
jgi:hypothetical protein